MLLMAVTLAAACSLIPLLLAHEVHPALGFAAGIATAYAWLELVRLTPGFLQGIIWLVGAGGILGALWICLMAWLRRLWT